MKTKKVLLPGMLATMAFAACTNEELVTMPNAIPEIDLSNRPMVGVVDLDFTPQSATRMAQGNDAFNQVVWENGDKIGARIIDMPNGGGYKDHSLNYSAINEYASSNYEYTKGQEDGIWRTEALLVEGNYMFYAPYNPSQGREASVFNFPYEQTINKIEAGKVNEDAIMNFFKNKDNQTVVVGHSFVDATEHTTKVSPFMEHLYAYPQFTLKVQEDFAAYVKDGAENDTIATDLKITKIIITNNQIKDKYQVNHTELIKMMRNEVAENKSDSDNYTDNDKVEAGRWQSALKLLRDGKTSDILTMPYSEAVDKKVVISLNEAYTAGSEDVVKFHAVLPGFAYNAKELDVNIVFADKNGTEWIFKAPMELDEALTFAPGKRYPREEYDFSDTYSKGYATKASAGQLVTYNVVSGEIEKYVADKDPVYIKYASELADWLATNVTNNTTTVSEGTDFILEKYKNLTGAEAWKNGKPMLQFNDSVANAVNQYLDKGKVVFTSQMIVSKDMTPSKDRFAFNGGIYQTAGTLSLDSVALGASTFKGTVTLKDITAEGKDMEFQGNATVNGGTYGNLTFAAGKTAKIQNTVTAATVTLNNGAAEIGKLTATAATVINGGTVTVPAEFEGNLGEITAMNATLNIAKAIGNGITLGLAGTGDNAGKYFQKVTLNVTADNFNLDNVKANYADINLNASTKMSSEFVGNWKSGAITNAAEKTLTLTNAVTIPNKEDNDKNYLRTFTNNGKVSGTLNIAEGAEVTNKYELTVAENNGKIITGADSRTYVNAGTGEVDNTSLSYVKSNAEQTVYATFENSKTVAEIEAAGPGLRYVNKLVFKNGLQIEKTFESELLNNISAIEIAGGEVVVKTYVSIGVNKIDITGSNVIFRGTLDRENTALLFKKGADFTVASGKAVTVAYMTMGVTAADKAINFNGKVVAKDADIYIGRGSAANYALELGGKIWNSWLQVTGTTAVPQSVAEYAFVDAVAKGGKVVVFQSFGMGSGVTISKDTEIDLNGNWISVGSGDAITVSAGKKLTIGNGSVYSIEDGAEVIKNLGGELIINSGTYEAKSTGSLPSAAIACDRGTGSTWSLTINGGTFKSNNFTAVSLQNNRASEGTAMTDGLADIKAGTFQGGGTYYDLYLSNVNAKVSDACEFVNDKVYIETEIAGKKYNSIINGNLTTSKEINGLIVTKDGKVDWSSIIPAE